HKGRVHTGWILMARSGQVYGILGTVALVEKDLEDKIVTDDIIRIRPKSNTSIRPGYMLTALSQPLYGRPLVKSLAYGSSIPHIDVGDVLSFEVARLDAREEHAIADLAEASAKARAYADILEREIAADASVIIDGFITSGRVDIAKP